MHLFHGYRYSWYDIQMRGYVVSIETQLFFCFRMLVIIFFKRYFVKQVYRYGYFSNMAENKDCTYCSNASFFIISSL